MDKQKPMAVDLLAAAKAVLGSTDYREHEDYARVDIDSLQALSDIVEDIGAALEEQK